MLTAIAVIAILALGIAAVLFLPGLLSPSKAPAHTPAPSSAVSSLAPSVAPSLSASLSPTIAPSAPGSVVPTAPPTVGPVGSPRLYTIRPGDTLARVAKKFKITVQQILDANPEINDPNNVFVGQVIVIPVAGP
jgi:LysM repeat protein